MNKNKVEPRVVINGTTNKEEIDIYFENDDMCKYFLAWWSMHGHDDFVKCCKDEGIIE